MPEQPSSSPLEFGKGAIPTPPEIQDSQFKLFAAPPLVDWSEPFHVPAVLVQKYQDGSSSCTAQATCYYAEALNQIENGLSERYSSRFIYSQTTMGYGQGTYIWKAMSIPLKQGAASEESVPGLDQSEAIMIDQSENKNAVLEAKTDKYAVIPRANIDAMAQIVRDYHGFVTGFNGHNNMFAPDGTVVDWSKNDWGHAVYVYGYEIHNGVKCLKFKNSWGSSWGDDGCGYFPESFVNSGMMFDAYVYAVLDDLDPKSIMLTAKQVKQLQALEGYNDPAGVVYWTGKLLSDYLAARLPDKVLTINASLNSL